MIDRHYKIKINGADYEVHICKVEDTKAHLTVNNEDFEVEGLIVNPTCMNIQTTPKPIMVSTPVVKPKSTVSNHKVKPPLPGVILDICVKEGDEIKKGQVLYVLEAMKMENHIESDYDGIVKRIHRTKGESLLENDVILTII